MTSVLFLGLRSVDPYWSWVMSLRCSQSLSQKISGYIPIVARLLSLFSAIHCFAGVDHHHSWTPDLARSLPTVPLVGASSRPLPVGETSILLLLHWSPWYFLNLACFWISSSLCSCFESDFWSACTGSFLISPKKKIYEPLKKWFIWEPSN